MGWKMHVARLAVSNRIPFGSELRSLKRRAFGYAPSESNLRDTVATFHSMRQAIEAQGHSLHDARVLEIGSGWFPVIPILCKAHGARSVLMTDLHRHMDDVTVRATEDYLERSGAIQGRRFSSLRAMKEAGIDYAAPLDLSRVGSGSVDLVLSRTVLEHIPPAQIVALHAALRPKVASQGLWVHQVDNSDHLEHRDKSISRLNFLTWSERKHELLSAIMKTGENRLRHHEYGPLFERAGLMVLADIKDLHAATLVRAKSLPLKPPYDVMAPEDLAILTSMFVLKGA